MSRRPCLAEEWFIDEGIASLGGLCPACRGAFRAELRFFSPNDREAFSNIYRMSRAIRVKAVLDGRLSNARKIDDWEALRVHRTLAGLTFMAAANFLANRNEAM